MALGGNMRPTLAIAMGIALAGCGRSNNTHAPHTITDNSTAEASNQSPTKNPIAPEPATAPEPAPDPDPIAALLDPSAPGSAPGRVALPDNTFPGTGVLISVHPGEGIAVERAVHHTAPNRQPVPSEPKTGAA